MSEEGKEKPGFKKVPTPAEAIRAKVEAGLIAEEKRRNEPLISADKVKEILGDKNE